MILRLGGSAAIHAASGVAAGITLVLAACTVAQVAKRGADRFARTAPAPNPPEPMAPAPAPRDPDAGPATG